MNTNTVTSKKFGKLFTCPVDGHIYAQPLYVSDVKMGPPGAGKLHNVVYVATMHNSIYAFDAYSGIQLWHVNLGPSFKTPPSDPQWYKYSNFQVEVGILSTPVIDLETNLLYAVAYIVEGTRPVYRLFALDIRDGSKKINDEGALIEATVSGTGIASINGKIAFDSTLQAQRPALLLAHGNIYIASASFADQDNYHGWVFAYDAATLKQRHVFNVTPNVPSRLQKSAELGLGWGGGVWQAGQGLSADSQGVYFLTGNGTFSPDDSDFGNCAISLSPDLSVRSWFASHNTDILNKDDVDLGSGGVLLLPETDLLVCGGKEGVLYVLRRDDLGGFCSTCNYPDGDTQVRQWFQATGLPKNGVLPPAPAQVRHHIHGSPVHWRNAEQGDLIFVWAEADWMQVFQFKRNAPPNDHDGSFVTISGKPHEGKPVSYSSMTTPEKSMPGGILSVSADSDKAGTGVVWASHPLTQDDPKKDDATQAAVPGILRAFDASDVSKELWNSHTTFVTS